MPHLHLETTPDLVEAPETDAILRRLADRLSAFPTISPAVVKAYATVYDTYTLGDGTAESGGHGFVHLSVAILDGRAANLVADMADAVYAELKVAYRTSLDAGRVKVTLELREMPARTYRK